MVDRRGIQIDSRSFGLFHLYSGGLYLSYLVNTLPQAQAPNDPKMELRNYG